MNLARRSPVSCFKRHDPDAPTRPPEVNHVRSWFYVALGAWAANLLFATLAVKPSVFALARAAAGGSDGPIGSEVDRLRRSRRWEIAEGVMRGNDLAMLYVMFVKPSAAESLLVVAAASVACLGIERVLARRVTRVDAPIPAS